MSFVERLKQSTVSGIQRVTISASASRCCALLAAIALAACGSNVIEGRPPFVSISDMSLQQDHLVAEFRVSNQNGVPMNIEAVDLTITVENTALLRENREHSLEIGANSAEEVEVDRPLDASALELLAALDRREVTSLAFQLTGRVRTVEDGYLRFEQKGHLYPVPGRPGHFRSAVTQARELRREDKI